MEEKLLEVKERFDKEFDNIFIEADRIIIEEECTDNGCKNDDDCYDRALENAHSIIEVFPELEVVDHYCHRHKYAICELRLSREYLDRKNDKKTSEKWQEIDNSGVIILDPDGWNRQNYQFSFYEELITHDEYERRKMFSTCLINRKDDGTISM